MYGRYGIVHWAALKPWLATAVNDLDGTAEMELAEGFWGTAPWPQHIPDKSPTVCWQSQAGAGAEAGHSPRHTL